MGGQCPKPAARSLFVLTASDAQKVAWPLRPEHMGGSRRERRQPRGVAEPRQGTSRVVRDVALRTVADPPGTGERDRGPAQADYAPRAPVRKDWVRRNLPGMHDFRSPDPTRGRFGTLGAGREYRSLRGSIVGMEAIGTSDATLGSAVVGVIMGSQSDWETMQHASRALTDLGVPHECRVVSAHRTPDLLFEYASTARSRGLRLIIAGAGGAAHLPGMCASKTSVPVLGVPVQSKALSGLDSLLSIVQMPAGVPVATFAVGAPGATNAALFAAASLAADDPALRDRLDAFRAAQTAKVLSQPDPRAALAAGGGA